MTEANVPVRCGGVAVVVLRGAGERARVLLMRRAKGMLAGEWCQVTGRIEAGETAWQAALREVTEETGIQPQQLYAADFCDSFYDAAANCIEVVPMFVAIVAPDSIVRLNPENTEFCWVDFTRAADLVPFSGHRTALPMIHRDFIEKPPPAWKLIWPSI